MKRVKRPWGWFRIKAQGKGWWLKQLHLNWGSTSLQRHQERGELWLVYVPPGCWHRITGKGDLLELAVGRPLEGDVERKSDAYGRAGARRRR